MIRELKLIIINVGTFLVNDRSSREKSKSSMSESLLNKINNEEFKTLSKTIDRLRFQFNRFQNTNVSE